MTSPSALISRLMRQFPRHPDVLELYEWMQRTAAERTQAVNKPAANGVSKPANKADRKVYMREYMRKRRRHGKGADAR